jgi:prepilin-type N-terminal cleavage/methylation domain-containing protein
MRRGFTVMELTITVAITGMIAAGAGMFYLESRIDFVRSDTNVTLTREASLAIETINRDLRNAAKASSTSERLLEIDQGDKVVVRYVIDRTGLSRDDGEEQLLIARFVRSLTVRQEAEGFAIQLALERELVPGRSVRMVRDAFVGARRK